MKGIYIIKKGNRTIMINPSDDLNKSRREFEEGMIIGLPEKNKESLNNTYSFEILELTERPYLEIWNYKLPQVSNVNYTSEIKISLSHGMIKQKQVENVVNWFFNTYSTDYLGMISSDDDNNYVILTVLKNDEIIDVYGFRDEVEPIFQNSNENKCIPKWVRRKRGGKI